MCILSPAKYTQETAAQKKYRLADFFNMFWDEYCKHPAKFIDP